MPDGTAHLSDSTLEQFAEGVLAADERARTEAHVGVCGRCAAEVEGYRALFAALSELPYYAPSPGFSEAVMARVVIAPQTAAVPDWLASLLPSTRRGWRMLTAALVVPIAALVAVLVWVFTQLTVSPTVLAQWGFRQVWDAGVNASSRTAAWVAGSGVLQWGESLVDPILAIPATTLSILVLLFALAIPLSLWSLVHLLRTPMGDTAHA